jgi:hypothetical protein
MGNVLLINLLIAVFSSTYQQIQENADQIWKFNRYKLVFEYVNVPILPPPFSLLSYLAFYTKLIFNFLFQFICCVRMEKSFSQIKLNGRLFSNVICLRRTFNNLIYIYIYIDQLDMFHYEIEKQYAKQYLQNVDVEEKETTDAKLKWTCEKYIFILLIFGW